MALSAFGDRTAPPGEDEVAAALGAAHPHWEAVRQRLGEMCDPYSEAWGFTAAGTGWGLRAARRPRRAEAGRGEARPADALTPGRPRSPRRPAPPASSGSWCAPARDLRPGW
jgi:hypothetical protein